MSIGWINSMQFSIIRALTQQPQGQLQRAQEQEDIQMQATKENAKKMGNVNHI